MLQDLISGLRVVGFQQFLHESVLVDLFISTIKLHDIEIKNIQIDSLVCLSDKVHETLESYLSQALSDYYSFPPFFRFLSRH